MLSCLMFILPLGNPVLLGDDGVGQLLGEVVQLGQAVQLQMCVVEAVVADVVVDIGNLAAPRRAAHKQGTQNTQRTRRKDQDESVGVRAREKGNVP